MNILHTRLLRNECILDQISADIGVIDNLGRQLCHRDTVHRTDVRNAMCGVACLRASEEHKHRKQQKRWLHLANVKDEPRRCLARLLALQEA